MRALVAVPEPVPAPVSRPYGPVWGPSSFPVAGRSRRATVTVLPTAATPVLTVDLGAIAANTRFFATRATGDLIAVVKADGFGHGAVDVATTALAHGASSLGVTSVAEALSLRDAGVTAPVLSWLNPVGSDVGSALRADVELAIPSLEHLAEVALAARATGTTALVHLHLDCGMARDGIAAAAWPELCRQARRHERAGILRVVGVMGHLGCADRAGDPCTTQAWRSFAYAALLARRVGLRPRRRHLAATSATLLEPRTHFEACRVGAGLVGIDPTGTVTLRPAMTLTAPVVSVRDVPAGTPVGYGHHHLTATATRLALLPVGYADGLPRATSGRAEVLVRGVRRPVVGLVSMDQVVVDVGDLPVSPGEVVTVFGPGDLGEPTVAEWAAWAGTIEHEIVTGTGTRVPRVVRSAR